MGITEKACTQIQGILEEIEEYFDDKADADYVDERYVGNREMNLMRDLQEARFWIDQLIRNNCHPEYK